MYRLDGFQKCISLRDVLKRDNDYSMGNISLETREDIEEATKLINNIHNPKIIEAYKTGIPSELANSSGVMWQPSLYNLVLESALASKYVVDEALINSRSLAIIGGGHHAEIETPYGFCTINTMAISAKYALNKVNSAAIFDLDTHYSNGCFDTLKDEQRAKIYSIWNQKLDKWKYFPNSTQVCHYKVDNAEDYFKNLDQILNNIKENKPELLIYHMGLDVLETDRMGGIKGMNEQKLIEREKLISQYIKELNIPLAIFLGGAYINWSNGTEFASIQREEVVSLQHTLLNILK